MSKLSGFRRMNLRGRMILCVCIVLAFLMLVGVMFYSLYNTMANDQTQSVYSLLTNELNAQISRSTQSLYDHATAISYSKSVQGAIYAPMPLERFQSLILARETINNYETLNPAILNIRIFNDGHSDVAVNNSYSRMEVSALKKLKKTGEPQFSALLRAENTPLCFIYILPIRNVMSGASSTDKAGVACAILYRLSDFINEELFSMGRVNYLTISDGACHAITPMPDDIATRIGAFDPGIHSLQIDGEDFIVYGFKLAETGWTLNYALPRSNVVSFSTGNQPKYILWLILGATAVIAFVLYNLCYIAYSIHTVTRSVISTRNTNDAHIRASKLPEIQMLASQLNQMLERIDSANAATAQAQQNVYNARLAKNRAEMAFYRNQINPHFLFNTLECIRSMAQHCGAESVERMIAPTSRMLHYSLYSGVLVSLREELENARNYIDLMNCRSMGAYLYREQADEAALSRPMVSMVLQPLYENAILHGNPPPHRRRFILSVRIALSGDGTMEIRIVDNGRGIPPESIRALNDFPESGNEIDFKENLGIHNIAMRLKRADPRCEIQFSSSQGHYTCVKLRIPTDLSLQDDMNLVSTGQS